MSRTHLAGSSSSSCAHYHRRLRRRRRRHYYRRKSCGEKNRWPKIHTHELSVYLTRQGPFLCTTQTRGIDRGGQRRFIICIQRERKRAGRERVSLGAGWLLIFFQSHPCLAYGRDAPGVGSSWVVYIVVLHRCASVYGITLCAKGEKKTLLRRLTDYWPVLKKRRREKEKVTRTRGLFFSSRPSK